MKAAGTTARLAAIAYAAATTVTGTAALLAGIASLVYARAQYRDLRPGHPAGWAWPAVFGLLLLMSGMVLIRARLLHLRDRTRNT